MEDTGPSIEDYLDILRRRKMLAIFTVPILLFLSLVIIMNLPPIFRSEATILIQGQEIPEELVRSTVRNYAEQQIEVTRQRIMTTSKISEMIGKHDLYIDMRDRSSMSQLADNFRDSMGVEMIEAEVPGQWGPNRANVAFIVSFMDKDPEKAQSVTAELTDLFLEENVKARTNKANETAKFLEEEADRMQARVQETENEIAKFKLEFADSLPELLQFNLTTIDRLEGQIIVAQDEIVRLSDQIHSLNLELSNISPFVQYSSDTSGRAITPRQRLMELKNEYSKLIISYAESHPDIKRLKEEIAIAEQEVASTGTEVSDEEAVNPVYRQIRSRIDAAGKELQRVRDRRIKMESDLADHKERVARTHQVQRNYDELTRDYTNKLEKYQELRAKQLEANIAQNMEAENKAGSFRIIEPATVPESPVKPNRLKLLFMAVILCGGAGVGLMLAAEFVDSGVRGVGNITRVLGQPPLAVVSHIYNGDDYKERHDNRLKLLWMSCGFCVFGVMFFHFFVMGLDIVWMKVMAKINVI